MNARQAKQLHAQIERNLKKNGRSLTRQRRVIIDGILRCGAHFDVELLADRIRADDPSIGRATVYRTVRLLAGTGLIKKRMLGETHAHYEIMQQDHGHFVCTSCGKIVELACPMLDNFLSTVSRAYDFKVHRHTIELFGICGTCGSETGA